MDMSEFAALMQKKYGIYKPERKPETVQNVSKSEVVRTKPNREENFFMMDLMILKNSLSVRMKAVRDRLQRVNPNAWRDLRLLWTLVHRMQEQMMQTMPESRWEYYNTLARSGRYHLDIEGPVRQGRMVLISDLHLAQLCELVMENECLMCLKTGREVETCPVRKALLEVAPPSEILGYRCEYADAAGDLVQGKEVHI